MAKSTIVCTGCGETRTLCARGMCRPCYGKDWWAQSTTKYVLTPEQKTRKAARRRDRYYADVEASREYSRIAARASYAKHQERLNAKSRDAYRADPAKEMARVRRYQARHKEEIRRYAKDRLLRRDYGLSIEEYERLHELQEGRCAICGNPETGLHGRYGTPLQLAVDHDHQTSQVRGLLCVFCNRGLGLFRDDPARLRAALAYLTAEREEVA